ncbi:MAG: hypothetical protein J7J99_04350, partial [Thermoprotei archaeon]|nr:hypothetical protein [Thermoprotei archaeon]
MKSFFHIVKTACLVLILIGLVFTLTSNVASSNKSEELKVVSSLGSRKVLILNPSPFNITKIAVVNLTFMPSEAYNNTISVYDENGNPVPFQILNATYFSGTHYYRTCSVGMLV